MSRHDQQSTSPSDWFRLRSGGADKRRLGSARQALRPVATPPNHDGMDLAELPPLHEAMLSPAEVEALFADFQCQAEAVQLMVRGRAAGPPPPKDVAESLRLACRGLLSGDIAKMQVRYQWRGARWIDTLEAKPDGVRLVRIRHAGG